MPSAIFLLTGGTSGLGLELARTLANQPGLRLLVGARQPDEAHALRAAVAPDRLTVLPLDLADLASVRRFADSSLGHVPAGGIVGVALNAGLQPFGPLRLDARGIELAFAANHLGHFALVHHILPRLARGAPVISVASGAHDPDDRIARLFGFRGAIFPSAERVAHGALDPDASSRQNALDRYATSKLCNVLFTLEMARRISAEQARFLAFDPGLMPGTGLARSRSAFERFGWTWLLPGLRHILPGVSTPELSARALAKLLTGADHRARTGIYVDFGLRETVPSHDARRRDLGGELYAVSAKLAAVEPLPAAHDV